MTINTDLQRLEPGSKILLFAVDGSAFDGPVLYFHNHPIPYTGAELENTGNLPVKSLWWQGVEYKPWPVSIEGLEVTSDGRAVTPTLNVANLDGSLSALCLAYQNMVQARVTIRMTFAHYLDARNFPDGNPQADPTQEKIDVFYIDSKTQEDNENIQFSLSSPPIYRELKSRPDKFTACARGAFADSTANHRVAIPAPDILLNGASRPMIRPLMPAGD